MLFQGCFFENSSVVLIKKQRLLIPKITKVNIGVANSKVSHLFPLEKKTNSDKIIKQYPERKSIGLSE
jgi:hypothetical protein